MRVHVGGCLVGNGVYSVVECTTECAEERRSDLFVPFQKEINAAVLPARRRFYLADVEAFVAPVAVVPDVGSADGRRYFRVTARSEWSEQFIQWLEAPHSYDNTAENDPMQEDS